MTAVHDFGGKCVLITGAGSGIGRESAFAFADAGATLELVDVDREGLERTALLVHHLGAKATTHVVDVSSASAMLALADDVHARHAAVDVLFNNAGVGCAGSFVGTELATWDWVYSINVKGVIHGCHFFVPRMIEGKRGGHVLNMASGAGLAASKATPVYSTSKFAVVGLSEALREELEPHGIQVTTVCPGVIDTAIIQNLRLSGDVSSDTSYRERSQRFYSRRAYGADRVAQAVVQAARGPGGLLPVSPEAWITYYGKRLAPALVRKLINAELPR
jgi:NAD(P)-dependent dehydrogenase (short-subunit alcohol dehydrogenase family)